MKGKKQGRRGRGQLAEEGRELDDEVRGGGEGALGGTGGVDPVLLTGAPLATPLSNSSRGRSLCA